MVYRKARKTDRSDTFLAFRSILITIDRPITSCYYQGIETQTNVLFFVDKMDCIWYHINMMKEEIFQRKTELTYGRGYVYSLQYHIVWCTKYRKAVLTGQAEQYCRDILKGIAGEYHFRIEAMEIMPDHVHLLLDCKPQFYIPDMVKIMKGNTARKLFMAFPELKKELWGGHLWNPSYCVVTVSDRSFDQVEQYVESQKQKG